MSKRTDYISWNEYFMGIALLSAKRSKDPNSQVGACIVDSNKRIVSMGYNGFPNGCSDDCLPWGRDGGMLDTKYAYVVHSELNAILNANTNVRGCTLYVTLFPCNECTKAIIQSGIKELYYISDKYADTDGVRASKKMLDMAGIKYTQMDLKGKKIELEF
ncbi:MAG: dCMP deaminase family protein [Clostridiales bacterium]|nr:dCMP deaminase family protein [Clostridiales bacterium]